jgi:hypothetical protein
MASFEEGGLKICKCADFSQKENREMSKETARKEERERERKQQTQRKYKFTTF